jgi:eukaryotic-like serine/threonine-protein kinase
MAEGQPKQIGRYEIVEELGRGGFGLVYRAYDPTVGRSVAIKVLTQASKDTLTRFRNEAMVAGNLRHENLVTVYEYGTHENVPYIAMEYLEGEDLHHIISSHKPLSLLDKCNIMSQVAEGLYCAHKNGVVHRDVKPANIMVLRDGAVKIMDFGIARLMNDREATRLTQQGYLIGTLLYMAPEQLAGAEFDSLCDIFAYGVIFYELITGKHPFDAPDARSMMYKLTFEDPRPLKEYAPEIPDALQQVISRIIQRDRELRYQSLKEVQFDTEPIRIDLRRERAASLMAQAQELSEKKQLDPALTVVQECLDLEPGNRAARALREQLLKQIRRRSLQPRIESLLASGEDHLAQRRFSDALQAFELALKLDRDNAYIHGRIEHAKGLLDHARQASDLLAEARREFEDQNLTAAYRNATEALRHDPQNPEAAEFLKTVQSVVERRQAEQRIDDAIRKAQSLLLVPAYDEAIEVLTGLGADADSPKVRRALDLVRNEKAAQERKQRLNSEMASSTNLLREHRVEEAAACLKKLQRDYPDNKEVAHLLAYAQKELAARARALAVESVVNEAGNLADLRNFDAALGILDQSLKKFPGEPALIRLLANTMAAKGSWERQQAVQSVLEKCEALRAEQRFAEAIEAVEGTLQMYTSEPALLNLLEHLEAEWAVQRRKEAVRKAREHAENLLREEQPEKALQQLQQALLKYPGDPVLAGLLGRAQEEVRALERARAVEGISKIVAQGLEAREFDKALRAVDQGLETWREEPTLLRLRADVLAAKQAWDRRQAIGQAVARARKLLADEQFVEALTTVAGALADYPADPALTGLQSDIEQGWEAYKRRQAILKLASEARVLLSRARLDEAAATLEQGLRDYPGEPELEKLSAQTAEALRARDRKLAIERAVQESQPLAAAKEFDRARRMLEQALSAYPAEDSLVRELASVRTAEAAWREQLAIERLLEQTAQLAGESRFDEALQLLSASALRAPSLADARKTIEAQKAEHLRRKAIAAAASAATLMLDQGRLEEAIQVLRKGANSYPGESEWEPLMARARRDVAARKRGEEIARVEREAGALATRKQFAEALEMLARGLETFPGESALLKLRETVEADRAGWEREQAIQRAVRNIEEFARQGNFEKALQAAGAALRDYGDAPPLVQLSKRVQGEWQACQRALAEARAMLEDGRFEDAVAALDPLAARFPADTEAAGMLGRAREQLLSQRRREAVEKVAAEALAMADRSDFDRAVGLADRSLKNWPGEGRLLEVRASILAAKDIEKARNLGRDRRYAEAIAAAEAALKNYPEDPTLPGLLSEFQFRQSLLIARRQLESGRPGDALDLLLKCTRGSSSDAEAVALIEQARTAIRASQIDAQAREARTLVDAGDFDRAVALLESGLRKWPDAASLREIRQTALAQKAALQRQQAIEAAVEQCRQLQQKGQLDAAIRLAEKFLVDFQNEPPLLALRQHLKEELAEQERLRKRARDLKELQEMQSAAAKARTAAEASELLARANRIAGKYPGDQEIQTAAADPIRHLSDIERAHQQAADRSFDAAIETCERYLARYPDHVLFGELQRKSELGRKVAYLEALRLRADAEPDLAKRAAILEGGLQRYPGEPGLADELRFIRNKLGLVDSILETARGCEREGKWDEALEQWNSLLGIYDQYPGLKKEIERVQRAGEAARSDAVEQWARQVEKALDAGDVATARKLLGQALSEQPGAARLQDLDSRLREIERKKARARELLAQAQAASERGRYAECQACLREAFQLDEFDPAFRKLVLTRLIDHAQSVVQTDWRQAETLVIEATSLQPGYAAPAEVMRTISDRKKDTAISDCLAKAEQLAKQGDLRGAVAELEQGLQTYPNEQKLKTRHGALSGEIRKAHEAASAELQHIDDSGKRAAQASEIEPLRVRATEIAAANQQDTEIATLAATTIRGLEQRAKDLRREELRRVIAANRKRVLIIAGSAAAVLAAVFTVPPLLRGPATIAVSVTTDVPGAAVEIGPEKCATPNCALKLAPGTYTAQAAKDGYKPAAKEITIAAGQAPIQLSLALEPLSQLLSVNTNFEGGQVYLDGSRAGDLRDGQFTASGIAPGRHILRVTSGSSEFRAEWNAAVGAPPELLRPIQAKDVQATIVANAGSAGSIACNCGAEPVKVDGAPAGSTASSGAASPLRDLKGGTRQIAIADRSVVLDIRPDPSLNVFLNLDRNVGVLTVETGEDRAKVFLNDKLYRRTTDHGKLRIPLDIGDYSIRVEKDGFQSPAPQQVALKKGEEKALVFALRRSPAYLEISGAVGGASVKLDGQTVGATDGKGGFRHDVSPGQHTVELSKDEYSPVQVTEQFAPGKTLQLGGARVAMAKLVKAPSPPDPKRVEQQDWSRIASSNNPEEFDTFVRNHPAGGPLVDQARARAAELRQQAQARAARDAEQAAWNQVDQNDKGQLQDYLSHHGTGQHADAARAKIAELDRQSAAEASAAQALREKEQKKLADEQAVLKTLKDFETAYNRKDIGTLQKIWSGLPAAAYRQQFDDAKELRFQLAPAGQPSVTGDSATVTCTRSLVYRGKILGVLQVSERVSVTLVRNSSGWLIGSMEKTR